MPWNPGVNFVGGQLMGQGIQNAAGILSDSLVKTLQKLDEEKKQRAFGDEVIDHLSQTQGPSGQPYVPADMLLKYHQANSTGKMGIVQAALANATFDQVAAHQDQQSDETAARTDLLQAQAHNEWSGTNAGGANDQLNLSQDELAAGAGIGKIPLRTSSRSFQWAEDPNAPANQGQAAPTPIDKFGRPVDPTNPKAEVAGLQQANGVIKMYGKPTQLQELINLGLFKPPTGTNAAAPAAGAAARAAAAGAAPLPKPGKVIMRGPDGKVGYVPQEQVQAAIAGGYSLVQ